MIPAQNIQPADLWKRSVADADRKLAYGSDPLQFGELRLPGTKGPHRVVILVHGGCYVDRLPSRDSRDTTFETFRPMAAALADAGVATWNIEYRRAGNPGGGWPGSFLDLAAGVDFCEPSQRPISWTSIAWWSLDIPQVDNSCTGSQRVQSCLHRAPFIQKIHCT